MSKVRIRIVYAVCLAIVAMCGPALGQSYLIVRATYGEGTRTMDVTLRVQSMVRNGALNFRLTNEALGVSDPAPGRRKQLVVVVRQGDGRTRDYLFDEKTQVVLQVGPESYQGRLSGEDQRRFDSYYSRWLQYRDTNNREEMGSMERRMRDIYARYKIPLTVDFDQVVSPGIVRPSPR